MRRGKQLTIESNVVGEGLSWSLLPALFDEWGRVEETEFADHHPLRQLVVTRRDTRDNSYDLSFMVQLYGSYNAMIY